MYLRTNNRDAGHSINGSNHEELRMPEDDARTQPVKETLRDVLELEGYEGQM
jgi:hypothetical protein